MNGEPGELDLLVAGGPLWAGPGLYYPRGRVAVKDGLVTEAGPDAPPEPAARRRLDAAGGLILPGLVNAHCHGPMVLFRGMADDLPLERWLFDHVFPAEARWVSEAMTELCGLLAAAEMLLSGTTCVLDAYFCPGGMMRAYARAGMRAVVAQGVIDFPAPGVPDPAQNLQVAEEFLTRWRGGHPLVTPALFAHSPLTCSPATLAGVARLAGEAGVPWHIHLAETRAEVARMREQYGATPGRHLARLGLLEGLGGAVHGVWLDPEEVGLLAAAGVPLVHCPESNLKLASGLAPVAAWLAAGATVALGTDGAASNNDLDLIGEIGSAARTAKLTAGDPAALSAERALDLALAGSAAALGLGGRVGRLAPGYAADLIVLDREAPHLNPPGPVPALLAYAARGGDVRQVVVAGEVVVADRRLATFDLAPVLAEVRSLAARLGRG